MGNITYIIGRFSDPRHHPYAFRKLRTTSGFQRSSQGPWRAPVFAGRCQWSQARSGAIGMRYVTLKRATAGGSDVRLSAVTAHYEERTKDGSGGQC